MILETLRNSSNLSETDRSIAQYLLNNTSELHELTITKLAHETYTSKGTIIRFCKKLGYGGFREFILRLMKEIGSDYLLSATIDRNRPFNDADTIETIKTNLSAMLKGTIDETKMDLDNHMVKQIADAALKAQQIYIFGKGESYLSGCVFKNSMAKIGHYCLMADEGGMALAYTSNCTVNDLAIFLSYSGVHRDYEVFAQELKASGVPIALITASPDCRLAKQASFVLTVPKSERVVGKVSNYSSLISFTYVLQIIYSEIFTHDYQENYRRKRETDQYIFKSFVEI
ncbi:MurR/RpiR family transcriptional regulator [Collinsella sp. AGMB00827]|uniref:MurR/RpiR family transcriptional regulator n=1 Tax=Collinsella ureilytica TaxID=2869515 RepID=A0ABS7MJ16_9ACTN|nr:MurR/RpiR family transcriptional regulator [Collinsella urealyticum]MBY4797080.1 MurR/RpiR family transcriptional regulator [Collinsella urealyticum]